MIINHITLRFLPNNLIHFHSRNIKDPKLVKELLIWTLGNTPESLLAYEIIKDLDEEKKKNKKN